MKEVLKSRARDPLIQRIPAIIHFSLGPFEHSLGADIRIWNSGEPVFYIGRGRVIVGARDYSH